jgi:hypothetical protein
MKCKRRQASAVRTACETYTDFVHPPLQILKRQPLIAYSEDERNLPGPAERHMAIAIDNARFEKLFGGHGGTIIGHDVLRRQKNPLPIIQYLRKLTGAVLKLEEGPVTDELRKQYTIDICTAFSGIYFKQVRWRLFLRDSSEVKEPSIEDDLPAALAATGRTRLLLHIYAGAPNSLTAGGSCLPSPLEAAAACNQANLLRELLAPITEQEMTLERHSKIFSALVVAMRKSAHLSGRILLDHFFANPRLNTGTHRLLKEGVRHADSGFVELILDKRRQVQSLGPTISLTKPEIRHILKEASPSVLRFLLSSNYVDPNYLDDTTPLTFAVQNHRYDLAGVLLQHGAHVDGVPRTGKLLTALWHAAKMGYRGYGDNRLPGIHFLLQHGADPDIHGDWRSPLRVVEGVWVDAYSLLELAKEKGKDVALHPDMWREFGKSETMERMSTSTRNGTYDIDAVYLS